MIDNHFVERTIQYGEYSRDGLVQDIREVRLTGEIRAPSSAASLVTRSARSGPLRGGRPALRGFPVPRLPFASEVTGNLEG